MNLKTSNNDICQQEEAVFQLAVQRAIDWYGYLAATDTFSTTLRFCSSVKIK